jgi:glycosyltransferase involved in cell wall biosynthesis
MAFSVLMLSGDRTVFDEVSAVRTRLLRYAEKSDSLTVLVTGLGQERTETYGNLSIIQPGGHSAIQNFVRLARTARRLSKTVSVVTAQDPYFIGLIGLYAAWGRAPLQIQIHGALFARAFVFESVRHFVESCVAFFVLKGASCVRSVSEQSARVARGVTRAPMSVLPVNIAVESYVRTYPCPKEYGEHPRILAVSRLSHEKNIELIIRAFAQLNTDAHLYVAGVGPMRQSLELCVQRLGLSERVHFLGWVAPQAYMAHASCVVHASLYEGYCMTLVEAVLSGVPVVTTDVGVARELGSTVHVVDGTEVALAAALTKTLTTPPSRAVLDEAKQTLQLALYSEEDTAERFVALLRTCGVADKKGTT